MRNTSGLTLRGQRHQSGAVSIFVVIFTALLITVLTVSFIRIMIRDQQQATETDLSQSAYDSAMAGVEDAKRALGRYYANETEDVLNKLNSGRCSTVAEIIRGDGARDTAETFIQSNSVADRRYDQAYTCVTVSLQTLDYIGQAGADETVIVPLRTPPTESINRIVVEWYSREDVSSDTDQFEIPSLGESSTRQLPLQSAWPRTRPSLLETQLIQAGPGFSLDQFDQSQGNRSNTNTLSLYPIRDLTGPPTHRFIDDARRSAVSPRLQSALCVQDLNSPGVSNWSPVYSCRASIIVPGPVGSSNNRALMHLRLTPRYNGTHFRVSMYNGNTPVKFDGVQPEVDATGRANDLFRRVTARVEPGGQALYPNGAVDIRSNFCKTFRVTNNVNDYVQGGCRPDIP